MKRLIAILLLCLIPVLAHGGATSIYPGNFLNDLDDVSTENAITNDILNWDGSAWVNRPVFSLPEITDVSITSPQSDHSLLYNGTYWMNVPHTYGEMYYHNDTGTLDFSTNTALINVTGIVNGAYSNMTLNQTAGSITTIDADTYTCNASVSFQSASAGDFDHHIGINGAEQDKCHANRRIGTGTDTGNIGITCILELNAADIVTLLVNSPSAETIKYESLNFNCDRDK